MKNIKHRKEKYCLSTKPIIPKRKSSSIPHHILNNDTSLSSNSNDNSIDNNNITNTSNPFEVPQEKFIYNPFQNESTQSPLNNNNNTFFKVSPTFSSTASSSLSIQAALLNNNKPHRKKKRIHSFNNVDSFSPKNYYTKQCSFRRCKEGDNVVKRKKKFKKEKHVSFKDSFVEIIEVQNWKDLFWENEIENCIENQKRLLNKESKRQTKERDKNEKCKCKCVVY